MEPNSLLGEMENRTFSIWQLLVVGQGPSLMLFFIFGVLSRCLEDAYGIIEPCKGKGSHRLDKGPSPEQA